MSPYHRRVLSLRAMLPAVLLTIAGCDRDPAVQCAALPGVETVTTRDRGVFVGELHGTDAMPKWFGELACHTAVRQRALLVGLEIPNVDQPRIDAFLASDGGPNARAALLRGWFWERDDEVQDGRASVAILGLLERLRGLRQAGLDVEVVAFDDMSGGSPAQRDARMAERLASAIRQSSARSWIALAGNLHARVGPLPDGSPSMAAHLERQGVPLASFDMRHGGGTAWICTGGRCGEHPVRGEPNADPRIDRKLRRTPAGFDGYLWVGPIQASPPATRAQSPAGVTVAAWAPGI